MGAAQQVHIEKKHLGSSLEPKEEHMIQRSGGGTDTWVVKSKPHKEEKEQEQVPKAGAEPGLREQVSLAATLGDESLLGVLRDTCLEFDLQRSGWYFREHFGELQSQDLERWIHMWVGTGLGWRRR